MSKTISRKRYEDRDDDDTERDSHPAYQRAYQEQLKRESLLWERRKSAPERPNP